MTPTRLRTLLTIAAVTAAAGWILTQLVETVGQRLLNVPWTAAAALALMSMALFAWGLMAKPRLQRKPGRAPMEPIVAARTAALALAASRTGAAVSGFYFGVALGLVPALDTPAGRGYALAAVAAVVASLALVLVGLWLESMCRLPGDGDAEDGGGPPSTKRPQTGQASTEAARRAA